MAYTPDPALDLRANIVEHLKDRFANIQAGVDGYSTTWDIVSSLDLSENERRAGDALGIYDLEEVTRPEIGSVSCELLLVIEFYHLCHGYEEADQALRRILGDIKRIMLSDIQCGKQALRMDPRKHDLQIPKSGRDPAIASGYSEWIIKYRHSPSDPRKRV